MPDMLVRLYDLPPQPPVPEGYTIRRPIAPERHVVLEWLAEHWNPHWRSESAVAFTQAPVHMFIALDAQNALVGFACYDCTALDFFGPTGVLESHRGRGLGGALLFAALLAMREKGYAYAIIGGAGPTAFYEKAVGATVIAGSVPGIYKDMLR